MRFWKLAIKIAKWKHALELALMEGRLVPDLSV
jgi:hypothetical protein